MATFETKKYLDYNGLAKFWELIKTKFIASVDATYTADNVVLNLKDANGTAIGSGVTLGAATATQAGVMTSSQAQKLADLDQVLINGVPFKGLNIAGTKVNTDDTAYANIGIVLEKVNGVESIVLKDLSTGGTAISSIDVSDFVIDGILESSDVTIVDGKPKLSLDFKLADGTTKSEVIDLSSLVDVYTAGNGIEISNNVVSVKVKNDEKYLTVTADGLATTEQLVTDYTNAATNAKTEAIAEAGNLADAAQAAAETTAKGYADDAQAAGEAAAAQALADAKSYVDPKFEAVDDKIGTVPEGKDVVTMIGDAETAAKGYADNQIEAAIKEVVGDGGTLAGTLADAKAYTDAEIAKVNAVIGKKAEGETAATGLYKDIADAQAAATTAGTTAAAEALADAKDYTDGKIAEINNAETGILAQAKGYTDDEIAKVNKDIEDKEKVTAEALTDLDDRVKVLEAVDHDKILTDANAYTDARLGDIPADTTVKAYVDGLANNYDTAGSAQAVYDAMVRLSDDEITAIVNGTAAA